MLRINNITLEKVNHTKFLGLQVDENLSWSIHVEYTAKKVNSAYFAIRNLRNVMEKQYLLNIYFALAYPHLKYLVLYWGTSAYAQRIFILQKRIIRLIFSLNPLESCRPVFLNKKIFTFYSILIYEAALYVKLNQNKFPLRENLHDHNTRNANHIHIHNFSLSTYTRGPYYLCSNIYNKLPNELKEITIISKFKKKLRDFLWASAFYSLQEYYEAN